VAHGRAPRKNPPVPATSRSLFAAAALLPDGWAHDVRIDIGAGGAIAAVASCADPRDAERAAGPVLPGLADVHGHAFQRALAGRAESRAGGHDDFWSWRTGMYRLVARLDPEQVHAIAAQLCVELLRGGFTAVAEFHYLHHAPDGTPYADPTEMSVQVVEAARAAGIGITHLPALYARGGFADEPLRDAQIRFRTDPPAVLRIAESLRARYAGDANVRIGLALHSLRAVSHAHLREAVAALHAADPGAPVHVHVAEQTAEVEQCLQATGQRPVAWLLAHAPVDARWCLVHATHVDERELDGMALSGAILGLCPTTEANLGDGVFPLPEWLARGGRFGVGTDSHVCRSAAEELRCLEYGQRLAHRRRCIAASAAQPSTGAALYCGAQDGGAAATGRPLRGIAVGQRADLIVLDGAHRDFEGLAGDALLDAFLFGGSSGLVRDVMVGGAWRVREGRHPREREIESAFRAALRALRA
jgi:formimidoylglutamate deiminase